MGVHHLGGEGVQARGFPLPLILEDFGMNPDLNTLVTALYPRMLVLSAKSANNRAPA